MVIVRARDPMRRAKLAGEVLRVASERHLIVLIADDPALAAKLGADGVHLPQAHSRIGANLRARHPRWLMTAALHGASPAPVFVDAVFLSAVFPTPSHPDRATLGASRANAIARTLRKPVYALGGIDAHSAARLSSAFVGIAAIGALAV